MTEHRPPYNVHKLNIEREIIDCAAVAGADPVMMLEDFYIASGEPVPDAIAHARRIAALLGVGPTQPTPQEAIYGR